MKVDEEVLGMKMVSSISSHLIDELIPKKFIPTSIRVSETFFIIRVLIDYSIFEIMGSNFGFWGHLIFKL